jgi:hypothetical protein
LYIQAGTLKTLRLALDMPLRDIQREMKDNGLPWELAKSFVLTPRASVASLEVS